MQYPPLQGVRTEHEKVLTRPAHQLSYTVLLGSGLSLHTSWPRTPLSPMGGACKAISPTPMFTRRGSRPASPATTSAERAVKARTGAPRPAGTRPPSCRLVGNGRAALGPSASPHVAPPRAALPLAVAWPSRPVPCLSACQTAPQP